MKIAKVLYFLFLFFFVSFSYAQWTTKYVTFDDSDNGTGYNTASVAVFGEDRFVALATSIVNWDSVRTCYLVGYKNADSAKGRLGTVTYTQKIFLLWGTGSDTVQMYNAFKIAPYPKKDLVFVANNDKDHSILTFKLTDNGVESAPYRMKTGPNKIWGIDVDDNGKVYVTVDSAAASYAAEVMIFQSIENEPKWQSTHDAAPIKTIDLPSSRYKGIAVDGAGKQMFIADYQNKKVLKYVGSPTTGYTAASGFDFHMREADTIPGRKPKTIACPIGLSYMRPFNILLVACDTFFRSGSGFNSAYSYGRIYVVDPNNGGLAGNSIGDTNLNVIDQAKWCFDQSGGSYTSQSGTRSGYTSTFDAGYDDQGNVYGQSFYSWTVEKWNYFPFIPTLTSVKPLKGTADQYKLSQNYPNPFNPSTKIEFSIPRSAFVTLKVYNILGQEVATLLNKEMEAGNYVATFNAGKLSSGTYFYELRAGEYTAKIKMLLVK